MLNIYYGSERIDKEKFIFQQIKGKTLLLVPDQFSLQAERDAFFYLQEKGLMIEGDPYVFAMELYAPFYLYHFVEHDYEKLKLQYQKHVEYFFDSHFIRGLMKI